MVVDNRSTRKKDEEVSEKFEIDRFNKRANTPRSNQFARHQERNLPREPRDVLHGGATEAPYPGTTDANVPGDEAFANVEQELKDVEHREPEPKVPTSNRGQGRGAPRARE